RRFRNRGDARTTWALTMLQRPSQKRNWRSALQDARAFSQHAPQYRQVLERGASAPLSKSRRRSNNLGAHYASAPLAKAELAFRTPRRWRVLPARPGIPAGLGARRDSAAFETEVTLEQPGRSLCFSAPRKSGTGVPHSKTLARSPGAPRNTDRSWSAARQRRFRNRGDARTTWALTMLQRPSQKRNWRSALQDAGAFSRRAPEYRQVLERGATAPLSKPR